MKTDTEINHMIGEAMTYGGDYLMRFARELERQTRHEITFHFQCGEVQKIFKPYIVKRESGCQVLFPLSELDEIVSNLLELIKG